MSIIKKKIIVILKGTIILFLLCIFLLNIFNKKSYDIAFIEITPRNYDITRSKMKAEEIFLTLTKENFQEKMNRIVGTSPIIVGGDIGWLGENYNLKEDYKKAVLNLKKGEISKKILTNDIGSFIFHLKDIRFNKNKKEINIQQIVVLNEISNETKQKKYLEISNLLEKMDKKGEELINLKDYDSNLLYIRNIKDTKDEKVETQVRKMQLYGIDNNKIDKILNLKKGEKFMFIIKEGIYIFKRKT